LKNINIFLALVIAALVGFMLYLNVLASRQDAAKKQSQTEAARQALERKRRGGEPQQQSEEATQEDNKN
jgi:NADH:ubiquinone oxidoreductase subunit 3 (subunit A)